MNWTEKARRESQPSLTEVYEKLLAIGGKEEASPALKETVNAATFKGASTRLNLQALGSGMKALYNQLIEDSSPDYAREVFFAKLSETGQTLVSTSHPTQLLPNKGIEAVQHLDEVLLKHAQNLYDGLPLSSSDEKAIRGAIAGLDNAIETAVIKPLTVPEEMERDRMLMFRTVEAIPQMVKTTLEAMDINSSSMLRNEELDNFSHLLESKNWAGDQDGKPLVTPELLLEGINLIERDRRNYFKKLLSDFNQTKDNPVLDSLIERLDDATYSTVQLVADLKPLRTALSIANPEETVTPFDSIILQAMSSHKPQIRQNRLMHETAFADIIRMVEGENAHPVITKEYIENFIHQIATNEDYRVRVTGIVENRLTNLKAVLPDIREEDYGFYQTMESLGIAVQNPDKIGEVIIAECGGTEDLLRGFALLNLMKQSRNRDAKQNIEVIPLTEYPERVLEAKDPETGKVTIPAVQMLLEALGNEYFLEHQLSITSGNYLLRNYGFTIAEIERPQGDVLTVGDVKKRYGIAKDDPEIPAEFDATPLRGTWRIMFAGSDMTRVGGQAAKVACDAAIEAVRKALLKIGILLEPYNGLGGGISRSNPTHTNVATRGQGNRMVEIPEEVAGTTLNRTVMNMEQALRGQHTERYDSSYQAEVTKKLLNIGNIANLPANEAVWHKETKPRTEAMINTHQELFYSESFSDLVSLTAHYAAATSLGARAMKRPQTGQAANNIVLFPPLMDVREMRAIGYQAALNTSGLCASLYYGISELLEKQKQGISLKELFMTDPKAENVINTAIYGVIMADMKTAERYAKHSPEAQAAFEKINAEYNQVSGQLLQLVAELTGKRVNKKLQGKEAAAALLEMLPSGLKQELAITLANVTSARQTLADRFDQVKSGKLSPDDIKRDGKDYKTIWNAMLTIMTAFERSPVAYLNPPLAMDIENHQKQGVMARAA